MLSVGWLFVAVVAAVLLTMWVTFTLTRLDRLHARLDAAQASLDAQLVRRAAALSHVADSADLSGLDGRELPAELRSRHLGVAQRALAARGADPDRQDAENAVGRAVVELAMAPDRVPTAAAAELLEASARVLIARRFYNDAVRDTRALRAGRLPRLFHMAGRRDLPQFFDIDDTVPPGPAIAAEPSPPDVAPSSLRATPAITEEDRP